MRRTPIPWSQELDILMHEALGWSHLKRFDELREQYRLLKLKKMVAKYQVKSFNVSDLSMATGMNNLKKNFLFSTIFS